MKNMTDKFLSESDREKIRSAVEDAERKTFGEIVPMVVSASYHYPMADVLGATVFAFPAAVLLTLVICSRLWIENRSMWVFIGLFFLLFVVCHMLVRQIPLLKRLFISRQEIDAEVEEAAIKAFFREGLYKTRDETGVLVFISIFERRVWVLADRGIHTHVGQEAWAGIVDHVTRGIREKRQAEAVCEAVGRIGVMLEEHFPVKNDDTDELKNLIVGS